VCEFVRVAVMNYRTSPGQKISNPIGKLQSQ